MYNMMYIDGLGLELGMTKIRKQIYLEKRQDQQLKRLAEARGVSEAEVIRQAVDRQLSPAVERPLPPSPEAWVIAHGKMLELQAQGPLPKEERRWTREELYEERLSRYGKSSD
jgi:hypothetical protein